MTLEATVKRAVQAIWHCSVKKSRNGQCVSGNDVFVSLPIVKPLYVSPDMPVACARRRVLIPYSGG